jgi:hypothetical protein
LPWALENTPQFTAGQLARPGNSEAVVDLVHSLLDTKASSRLEKLT